MKPLLDRIKAGEIIIADGAMGTMLLERGLRPGECPEALNLTHGSLLEDIARMYLEAGAEIVQTNTFGGSPLKLERFGLSAQAAEINRTAVDAARRAVGDCGYISGSVGPSGRMLKPYGDVDPAQLQESFAAQIRVLIEAGVDLLCIETMTDLTEAQLALGAARSISTTIPIMATMTFDPGPNGFHTIMGVSIKEAAHGLEEAGADLIGSNCGNGMEEMIKVAQGFRKHGHRPLVIQSNAGLPILKEGRAIYCETPAFMAEKALKLVEIGVSVIGGCCGTTPAHIRAIAQKIREGKK